MPWESSVLADELKREYTRAKRRRNRWGAKVATKLTAPTLSVAPMVTAAAGSDLTPITGGVDVMQARVDEINGFLKMSQVLLTLISS